MMSDEYQLTSGEKCWCLSKTASLEEAKQIMECLKIVKSDPGLSAMLRLMEIHIRDATGEGRE